MSKMPSDALILFYQGDYTILIEKSLDKENRATRLAHELAHYHTCTLSKYYSSKEEILKNEKIANDYNTRRDRMNEDFLNREKTIDNIMKIINASSNSIAFDIEGVWGIGKTFLLDLLKDKLNELNQNKPQYLVLSYNCWRYDYYEEPLIAIISSIIASFEDPYKDVLSSFKKTSKDKIISIFKGIASSFLKNKIGVDLIGVYDDYKTNYSDDKAKKYEFDYYQGFTKAISDVRNQFAELAKDYKIILIIDELDRCLPSYAIKVMERIHHLFEEINNTVVIYSLDRSQLENTIRNIFGTDVNSAEYLKKFIDFTITLDTGNAEDFRKHFSPSLIATIDSHFDTEGVSSEDLKVTNDFFSKILSSLEIRKVKKIIQKIELIFNLILKDENNLDYSLVIAVFIYMIYQKEFRTLLNHIFSRKIDTDNYKSFRDFLKLRIELSSSPSHPYLFAISSETYRHNIAWLLYNFDPSLTKNFLVRLNRTNTFKNMEREIGLFHKFTEYSEIIK